ncbi:hypothetical protein BO71DRAFT_452448 [Aspergillus ellipticus CBS 707.79]|uniref:Zn(2)-C6 fungal-type domain-containing protein n=1 Tax=Aspergillus ellipticus CBS 707.79 TaxID=1448320 RepID=A0A319D018_9EURO|nr:hypothetical protein BO71DRAFT_452448 [Aspergillus ellipticus CBS 707.79]
MYAHSSPAVQDILLPRPRRQRLKISNACHACRLRKAKCDGSRPACGRCQERQKICTYSSGSTAVGHRQQPRPKRKLASSQVSAPSFETPSPSIIQQFSRLAPLPENQHQDHSEDPRPDQTHTYYPAHGRFAGDVAAAIDSRAGLAPTTSHLVPFVDAPLFGEVDLESPCLDTTELPPRAYADRLVGIYWQHVHPVEPIFDPERFYHDYKTCCSNPGAPDRDIQLSILNGVFALAVQRQESTPQQSRDEEGNRYFRRAWALLRPEKILWMSGAIEIVQCLMILNRYLHCTNNQQKTWMTAGVAMRMAQNMCGNCGDGVEERKLKQRVWASCVAMDRCVSWSLGRTSASSLIPRTDSGQDTEYMTRGMELHEIGNQIQLAQTQTRSRPSARLGLPRLYQHDEYHAVAVQLDACLNQWEDSLPDGWKLHRLANAVDRTSRVEGYLLQLRLLQAQIYLFRPMLTHIYTTKSHQTVTTLNDHVLRESARMCIAAAQSITTLILQTTEPDQPMGLLSWWYRVYYLHIAGTNFLAAMFAPDLFTEEVTSSWRDGLGVEENYFPIEESYSLAIYSRERHER